MPFDGDRGDDGAVNVVEDEVYEALGDRTRRFAVYYLRSRGRVGVDALADVVTGWENAEDGGMASREDRTEVLAALRDEHLPLLEDAGIVRYDGAAGAVTLASLAEPVRSLIDAAYGTEGNTDAQP